MPCSYCGKDGHNSTTCPQRIADDKIAQKERELAAKEEGMKFGVLHGAGDHIDNRKVEFSLGGISLPPCCIIA